MGTKLPPSEIKRFEVTEVYAHPDAKVDIVLVHGLNGHPRDTWTAANGTFWPTDLLPVTLKSHQARVLVYGYNADVVAFGSGNSPSSDMIYQHAQSLVTNLAMERLSEETTDHPIIFVAHSLGGILVKRALELSNDLTSQHADENRNIFVSTYGIIFLGTPHLGADPAKWGVVLEKMVHTLMPRKIISSDAQMVKTLKTNNETLQNINLHFLDILPKFRLVMAHEEMETDMKGTKGLIVDQSSAAPPLPDVTYFGIAATHSGMCKYSSKNSPGYLNVSTNLKTWVAEAPKFIVVRQEFEKRLRRQAKEAYVAEVLGVFPTGASNTPAPSNTPSMNNSTTMLPPTISTESTESQTPPFIKPSGFRPNALFVGREAEMAELHRMIFDKKKRSQGTSAVLIQSMPGGGKTHLARQFVFDHRDEFPGGIFWVRAKSRQEFTAGFWDIARKAALKQQIIASPSPSSDDSDVWMKTVKKWLNRREGWLLVLDGIHFDGVEGMQRFIPDGRETAIIYTSTEKSASGNHLWMSPQIIRLPLLSAREAQFLLLKELDKKEPFSKEDLTNSMELVQSMGFLPVVIHTVAQRLKDTDEHLAKFAKSYASEPRLRGLGTYIAVVDQLKVLGAFEALHLMYILSFFSQHIPVEMIHLGLSILEGQHIPCRTSGTLNSTFRILNMFALIDRNAVEEVIQSSQSSRTTNSRDMLADNIDVIRLHSVVQGFFVDTLHADKDRTVYPKWLDRAVQVFCCSYDLAHERISRKANAGLVEDYRLYEIHGNRLREHLTRHKNLPMPETLTMLDLRLSNIKTEIEKRTPESSNFIARGRPDAFQVSIFDRTSSSSDTAPDTPGYELRLQSAVSTWGGEPYDIKEQTESPQSIKIIEHGLSEVTRQPHIWEYRERRGFPPYVDEDAGYYSDRESATTMTAQPSQHTVTRSEDTPNTPDGEWQTVRARSRPKTDVRHHRTTKMLESQRYHDRAGAFRAVGTIDPRAIHPRLTYQTAGINRETAGGYVENAQNRNGSRGRMSAHSSAELALAHISKNSPPPLRGGGMIMDRRSSSQSHSDRPRMMSGRPSYAVAIASSNNDSIHSARPASSSGSISSAPVGSPPQTSAIEALQRFPIEVIRQPPSPETSRIEIIPMPPYPDLPVSKQDHLFDLPHANDSTLDPAANIYPRMPGSVPYERVGRPRTASSPLRFDHLAYSESMPASFTDGELQIDDQLDHLSLSSPNILRGETYVPGHPELSGNGGYTSQPMSRDNSGQGPGKENRRPSLAETEPIPSLPNFSPKIQTSYQLYAQRHDPASRPSLKRSPPLRFAARLDDLEPRPRSRFNPHAPVFAPQRPGPASGSPSRNPSPAPYPTGGEAMGRTGSGGVRIDGRVIRFGDGLEDVVVDEARQRTERNRERIMEGRR